jgi:hypothetical protein
MAHLYLSENVHPAPGEARVGLILSDHPEPNWTPLIRLADAVAPPATGTVGGAPPWEPMTPLPPGSADLATPVDESALFASVASYIKAAPQNAARLATYLAGLNRQQDARLEQAAAQASDPQGELARLAEAKLGDGSALSLADAYRAASRERPDLYERARTATYLPDRPGLETRLTR